MTPAPMRAAKSSVAADTWTRRPSSVMWELLAEHALSQGADITLRQQR